MNAEQWLADLEGKALKALFILEHPATNDPSSPVDSADIDAREMQAFFDAATPAAFLRLVNMVRTLANRAGDYTATCPFKAPAVRPAEWICPDPKHECSNANLCEIEAAYQLGREPSVGMRDRRGYEL